MTGKSVMRIGVVCGAVGIVLGVIYFFMARAVKQREVSLGGRPQTAVERARLQEQVQKTMKLLEDQRRLQEQFRLGQPPAGMMPGLSPVQGPGQSEALKALRTIEEINRINRMNREARPLTPQPPSTERPQPSIPPSPPPPK